MKLPNKADVWKKALVYKSCTASQVYQVQRNMDLYFCSAVNV